jgi:hypothetical protein
VSKFIFRCPKSFYGERNEVYTFSGNLAFTLRKLMQEKTYTKKYSLLKRVSRACVAMAINCALTKLD